MLVGLIAVVDVGLLLLVVGEHPLKVRVGGSQRTLRSFFSATSSSAGGTVVKQSRIQPS